MELTILETMAAGGTAGIWALVYVGWRFDRRILVLELTVESIVDLLQKGAK